MRDGDGANKREKREDLLSTSIPSSTSFRWLFHKKYKLFTIPCYAYGFKNKEGR